MKSVPIIKIAKPVPPKILKELPLWPDAVEDQRVEFDGCKVESGSFVDVTQLQVDSSLLIGIDFLGLQLERCEITDAQLTKVDCIGLRAPDASLLRVEIADARMTGTDFGASYLEDCTFRNLKLDEAGFRFANLKRVRFEQCILRKADFSGAKMQHVTFIGCDFDGTNFDSAICASVDVRGQNLSTVKGVYGLKNVQITNEQLIQLAPLLAAELNFAIDDGAYCIESAS